MKAWHFVKVNKLRDGRLMFGGDNGIAIMEPEKVKFATQLAFGISTAHARQGTFDPGFGMLEKLIRLELILLAITSSVIPTLLISCLPFKPPACLPRATSGGSQAALRAKPSARRALSLNHTSPAARREGKPFRLP